MATTAAPSVAHTRPTGVPATRARGLELLGLLALGVVVLGQWLAAAGVPIAAAVATVALPLLFLAGGAWGGRAWVTERQREASQADFVRGRLARVLPPLALFVVVGSALPAVLSFVGLDGEPAGAVLGDVARPLWLAGVFVLLTAVAPMPRRLRSTLRGGTRRTAYAGRVADLLGGAALVVLIAGMLRLDGVPLGSGASASLLVAGAWAAALLLCYELGLRHAEGMSPRRERGLAVGALGLGALGLIVAGSGATPDVTALVLAAAAFVLLGLALAGRPLLDDLTGRFGRFGRFGRLGRLGGSARPTATAAVARRGVPRPVSVTWWHDRLAIGGASLAGLALCGYAVSGAADLSGAGAGALELSAGTCVVALLAGWALVASTARRWR